jgi:hypothetical protein
MAPPGSPGGQEADQDQMRAGGGVAGRDRVGNLPWTPETTVPWR